MTPNELRILKESRLCESELRNVLDYNPDTGIFTWIKSKTNWVKIGDVAGGLRLDGYVQIMIKRTQYTGHRLAWLYMTGRWPRKSIDHLNGIKNDNRIANLREAGPSINGQNRRKEGKNNISGYLGVHPHSNGKGYVAIVELGGVVHYAGYFVDPKDAHNAYLKKKRVIHEGCTI